MKNKKLLIIVASVTTVILCAICVVGSIIYANTPAGKAALATNSASTELAKAAIIRTSAVTSTAVPTNTKEPAETPSATETPEPTVTPTKAPDPLTFEGSGAKIIDLPTNFGGAILHAKYSGSSNFILSSFDENNELVNVLVNEIGAYDGIRPLDFMESEKSVRLQVESSGPWVITVSPISPDNIPKCVIPGKCEGVGDTLLYLSGGKPDIGTFTHSGTSNFIVSSYGDQLDLLINEIGAYSGEVLISGDTFILEIQADGLWTIDIKTR